MFKEEGYKLMGAAFEVHNQLGYGMAEAAAGGRQGSDSPEREPIRPATRIPWAVSLQWLEALRTLEWHAQRRQPWAWGWLIGSNRQLRALGRSQPQSLAIPRSPAIPADHGLPDRK